MTNNDCFFHECSKIFFFYVFLNNMQINEINNLSFGVRYKLIPPDVIAKRIRENVPYPQIAKEFNVPTAVVFRSVKNRLLSLSDDKGNSDIHMLYSNKYSIEEIKIMLGYPVSYIKSVINRFNTGLKSESDSDDLVQSIVDKLGLDHDVLKNLK